jgi:hypothetical protein
VLSNIGTLVGSLTPPSNRVEASARQEVAPICNLETHPVSFVKRPIYARRKASLCRPIRPYSVWPASAVHATILNGGQAFMADRARNQDGLGKAVTFNVITPMTRFGTWVVRILLLYLDRVKSTQETAKRLSFLPFVHWVVVKRNAFPHLAPDQPKEQLNYDYLFFLSTFNGPWSPYIDAFADVLFHALDAVWFWSIGYPFARPVSGLKAYIVRNQVESDHAYSAYPGASVRDVRSAIELYHELVRFEEEAKCLNAAQFEAEFGRLLIRVQNKLGSFGTLPE